MLHHIEHADKGKIISTSNYYHILLHNPILSQSPKKFNNSLVDKRKLGFIYKMCVNDLTSLSKPCLTHPAWTINSTTDSKNYMKILHIFSFNNVLYNLLSQWKDDYVLYFQTCQPLA